MGRGHTSQEGEARPRCVHCTQDVILKLFDDHVMGTGALQGLDTTGRVERGCTSCVSVCVEHLP
jgi:hypothetical protein